MATAPHLSARTLAEGEGWRLDDILCSAGPGDPALEERHDRVSISFVVGGSFCYRSPLGATTLTPGSVLLGNYAHPFECSHDHGRGDRCLSFKLEPAYFEGVAAALAGWRGQPAFAASRLPPQGGLAPVAARLQAAAAEAKAPANSDELASWVAIEALRLAAGLPRERRNPTSADERRVSAVVRHLETRSAEPADLARLAGLARMSPFHFLRVFRQVVGTTPHRYVVRRRLEAAALLLRDPTRAVTEVAFEVGFDDLSAFNRAFRRTFGRTPSAFRRAL